MRWPETCRPAAEARDGAIAPISSGAIMMRSGMWRASARARAVYDRIATASPLVRYDRMLNRHES